MRPVPRLTECFPTRALAVLALGLAATSAPAAPGTTLGPDPVLGGGEYSTGGGITLAVELRNLAGKTGICGIWAQSKRLTAYVRHEGPRMLSKGSIALDGRVLTHDLGFLNRVEPAASYAGAPAGCLRLDRPWRAGDAHRRPELRLPRQELMLANGGRKSGGPRITFRPRPGENPAMTAGSLLPESWTSHDLGTAGD